MYNVNKVKCKILKNLIILKKLAKTDTLHYHQIEQKGQICHKKLDFVHPMENIGF